MWELSQKKKCLPLTGFAEFTSKLSTSPPPKRVLQETPLQKKQRLAKEKAAAHEEELKPKIEEYRAQQKKFSALHEATAGATSTADKGENGANGANGDAEKEELPEGYTKNPFCTLFVARLPFDITEGKLRRVFSKWGTIKKIKLLTRKNGEPRGMAFIEYEEEAQMRAAYERADAMKLGKNLDGKDIRILVDVERGRTVPDWLPRRLGGGLGGTRRGAARVNDRSSGRPGSRPVHDRGHGGAGGFRGGRPMDRGRDYNRDRDRGRGDRGRHDRDRGRDHDRGRYDRKDRDRRSSRDDDRKRGRY